MIAESYAKAEKEPAQDRMVTKATPNLEEQQARWERPDNPGNSGRGEVMLPGIP